MVVREAGADVKALDTEGYLMPDGKFRAFTFVGSYPIFYKTKDGGCLCAKCASLDGQTTDPDDPQWFIVAADIHWEGEPKECSNCDEGIESAYGPVEKAANA